MPGGKDTKLSCYMMLYIPSITNEVGKNNSRMKVGKVIRRYSHDGIHIIAVVQMIACLHYSETIMVEKTSSLGVSPLPEVSI